MALFKLEKVLKHLIALFVFVLTLGVTIGIIYLEYSTNMTPTGTVEQYNGSFQQDNDFEIREKYPKQINELLLTTHTHVIMFSIIFFCMGLVFYFNSIVNGFWKKFLIFEPLVSTIITFSSIWGIRYIDSDFVYITIVSAFLMYASFYIMSFISLYELVFKKDV